MISNFISFVYKDQIVEIKNPNPNETLLNYIRTKLKKTGTKEGCAEGGCGACTIVIGELNNNDLQFGSILIDMGSEKTSLGLFKNLALSLYRLWFSLLLAAHAGDRKNKF